MRNSKYYIAIDEYERRISGLLHEKSFIELGEEKQMMLIIDFLCRMLQIPKEIFI